MSIKNQLYSHVVVCFSHSALFFFCLSFGTNSFSLAVLTTLSLSFSLSLAVVPVHPLI